MKRIAYSPKLMKDCIEDPGRRTRCMHYSMMKDKCTRRWAGRTPGNPCECFKDRTRGVA